MHFPRDAFWSMTFDHAHALVRSISDGPWMHLHQVHLSDAISFPFFCKYFSIQFRIARMFAMSFLHAAFDKRLNSNQKSNLNLEYLESIFGKHRKMAKTIIECASNVLRMQIDIPNALNYRCVVKLD